MFDLARVRGRSVICPPAASQAVGGLAHRRDDHYDLVPRVSLAHDFGGAFFIRCKSATLDPPNFSGQSGPREISYTNTLQPFAAAPRTFEMERSVCKLDESYMQLR